MSTEIKFTCPQCGQESFKLDFNPQSLEDFVDAECNGCGRKITLADIGSKAVDMAESKIGGVLSGVFGDVFKKS